MRLLLDTHVVLWWCSDHRRLQLRARRAIAGADEAWVSAASAWEVSIKTALGRLRPPEPFEHAVDASGFSQLPITFRHAASAGALPAHHHDPFDRMLIAQAQLEGLTLVTHDEVFARYGVPVLTA
jgi:PIN domain nuclease of toxin-antitoxin system